jgi:conserved hypothetical protein, YceG family
MRVVKVLFAAFALLIILASGFSYWLYHSLNTPHSHDKANEFVVIEKGSTPKEIIAKLADDGIISSYAATLIYLRTFGDGTKLQAGEYQFQSPISSLQVLKELEKGEDRTTKLTIPEGFTRFDIAKRIVEKFPQNPPIQDTDVLKLMDDITLIHDIDPKATNLEGYMYPSTYSFPREAAPKDIIKTMVEQFRKVWKPEWNDVAKSLGRTPNEIVTIGSLIETESGVEAERPTVASVIYNRLNKHIPLGIDQTVVYVAKMQNRWDGTINQSDLDADSPYNTRKYGGLPPGPISSVSESALKAALNPAQTDFIYYVRNVQLNDGSHWFYSSAAEFEKGKAEYQKWLEQQREEKRQEEQNK